MFDPEEAAREVLEVFTTDIIEAGLDPSRASVEVIGLEDEDDLMNIMTTLSIGGMIPSPTMAMMPRGPEKAAMGIIQSVMAGIMLGQRMAGEVDTPHNGERPISEADAKALEDLFKQ